MTATAADLDALVRSAEGAFSAAATPAELENAKAQFLGKSGSVTALMRGMAQLAPEEKKTRGENAPCIGPQGVRRRRVTLQKSTVQSQ